ncbi:MAG: hypothetical protein N3A57_05010 [Negativicutes bacterium]|nr:hypothetical protein [Negativicutes bacterium]
MMLYRVYAVADNIDLAGVENILSRDGRVSRLKLSRINPKSIAIRNAPLTVELPRQTVHIGDRQFPADARARLYDFGVCSLMLAVKLPEDTQYEEICRLAEQTGVESVPEQPFREPLEELLEVVVPAISGAHHWDFCEDLVVYAFTGWDEKWDPVPLILGDCQKVSADTRREVLNKRFSYSDDFVLLGWDSAVVYEPDMSQDIPDLLAFANAQLIELRHYDHALDSKIDEMYDTIAEAGRKPSFRRYKDYRRIRMDMLELLADMANITSRIRNALQITEDIYYARVYNAYQQILRTRDWQSNIERKAAVVQNTYNMLSEEVVTARGELLEIIIIVLILTEVVMGVINLWH